MSAPGKLGVVRSVQAILAAVLWIALALAAVKVSHDFYRYIDRSIHVTVDDAEANIAYALATEGRYGFFASPILVGMDRVNGQFNYGPWYFYLAAGLVYLFGFSVTLVRSIHLWVILASIPVAAWWFRGPNRIIAAGLYGFGILYCFDASHWPMARPDILVSAFALGFVISAGLAWQTSRRIYWFGAGLTATCGAFTHLIAASLLPSAALVLVLAAWLSKAAADSSSRGRRFIGDALALAAGVLAGLVMFYGSFGFGFATQWQFFTAYRELTASQITYEQVMANHLSHAFGYLSEPAQLAVLGTFAVGWIASAIALWIDAPRRQLIHSRLLIPLIVWTAYGASNLFYQNYHQGYAILHQVFFLWTAAAEVWLLFELVARRVRIAPALAIIAMGLLFFQANRQIAWQFSGTSWKVVRSVTWASFADYSERVLQPIPARSTVWGSIVFGMEAPGRVQLVQWSDAMSVFPRVEESARAELIPDFVIFGYVEARDNLISVLQGGETLLNMTAERLPATDYRMVSLVSATPYGATRTYARRTPGEGRARSHPLVSVYDAEHRQWLTRVGTQISAAFRPASPVSLRIGYAAEPRESPATSAVVADLEAGRYLLRVAVTPGGGRSARRLIAATSVTMLRQTIGEMGADGDFASYLDRDEEVYLVLVHPGGPLYVSQFDDGDAPAIGAVTVFPVLGLLDPDEVPSRWRRLPPLDTWKPVIGITAKAEGETLRIEGDASQHGYQFTGPMVRVREKNLVTVRIPTRVEQGTVCTGVLNGDDSQWIASPTAAREDVQFMMDATQGFRVAITNCKSSPDDIVSRFVIWPGMFAVEPAAAFYADRLVAAALYPEISKAPEPAGLEVRTLPNNLRLTKAEVDGPLRSLQPADFGYRANIVQHRGDRWTVSGRAEGPFTYLLQSSEQHLTSTTRLLVAGRVERGGVTVGLLKNNQWVGQLNVTEPGDFTMVLAPPSSGNYSVLIANNLRPDALDTSVTITRLGLFGK